MNSQESQPEESFNRGRTNDSFETYLSFDNQSLICISEVEVYDDEVLDYHYPLIPECCSTLTEPALAEQDSLALKGYPSNPNHQPVHSDSDEMLIISTRAPPSGLNTSLPPSDLGSRRRRKLLRAALFLALAIVVILYIVLTQRNKDSEARGGVAVGQETVAEEIVGQEPVDQEAVGQGGSTHFFVPTPAPSFESEKSFTFQVLSQAVEDPDLLLDSTTPQGMAFQALLTNELTDAFRIKQRFALMVIYHATDGDNWLWTNGWQNEAEDECRWYGVSACRMQSHGSLAVSKISLDSNKLQGTLPSEVCLLGSLENIGISGNMMHGELPSCLTSLPALRDVDVDRNEFSSSLPPGFFLMPSLKNLILSNNQFSGNLVAMFEAEGSSFNAFQHLTTLQLHNNNFEGDLPSTLFFLSALDTLTLHGNDAITGRVDVLCNNHDLTLLTADCQNVHCTCCTECF